jgi:hypothetical protein
MVLADTLELGVLPSVLEFDVTDEDIALARPSSPKDCMMSRSLRRTIFLKYGLQVEVFTAFTSLKVCSLGDTRAYFHEHSKTIQKFDAGYDVAPFTGVATQIRA